VLDESEKFLSPSASAVMLPYAQLRTIFILLHGKKNRATNLQVIHARSLGHDPSNISAPRSSANLSINIRRARSYILYAAAALSAQYTSVKLSHVAVPPQMLKTTISSVYDAYITVPKRIGPLSRVKRCMTLSEEPLYPTSRSRKLVPLKLPLRVAPMVLSLPVELRRGPVYHSEWKNDAVLLKNPWAGTLYWKVFISKPDCIPAPHLGSKFSGRARVTEQSGTKMAAATRNIRASMVEVVRDEGRCDSKLNSKVPTMTVFKGLLSK